MSIFQRSSSRLTHCLIVIFHTNLLERQLHFGRSDMCNQDVRLPSILPKRWILSPRQLLALCTRPSGQPQEDTRG
jgi:hypothetical protein